MRRGAADGHRERGGWEREREEEEEEEKHILETPLKKHEILKKKTFDNSHKG